MTINSQSSQLREPALSTEIRFLRLPEVCNRVGLQRSQIYAMERAGKFPHRVKLTARASVWRSDEIAAWIEQRTASARREPTEAAA
jgi:prophage regulatory protein